MLYSGLTHPLYCALLIDMITVLMRSPIASSAHEFNAQAHPLCSGSASARRMIKYDVSILLNGGVVMDE